MAVVACALLPATAGAQTYTVGSLDLPPGGTPSICGGDPCTVVQGQVAPQSTGTYVLRAPVDGTIVSWRYRSASQGSSYSLRVLRPANQQETAFNALASAASPPIGDAEDLVRGPFAVSIPVRAGDRIGLRSHGPEYGVPVATTGHNDPATGDGVRYFAPDVADGATQSWTDAGNTGQQVLVQATIQPGPPPPFVAPPPPPPPDFRLERNPPGRFTPTMRPRARLQIPLMLRRLNGSSGPIALSVSQPPPGTSATLSHTTIDGVSDTPLFVTIAPRPGRAARPGSYKLRVTATPSGPAAGPGPRTLLPPVAVLEELAVRLQGIEVTQGVQTFGQPFGGAYYGVPLMRGKKTIARVFADFLGITGRFRGRQPRLRPELGVALYAFDSRGRQLPFSPLVPDYVPPSSRLRVNDEGLTTEERVSPQAFTFELPGTWTKRGRLRLTAVVLGTSFDRTGADVCVQVACGAQPRTTLPGIDFDTPPRARYVNALATRPWNAQDGRFDVGLPSIRSFARMQAMLPIPMLFLNREDVPSPVPRFRDVRVVSEKAILEATQDYDDHIGRPGDFTLGTFVPLSGKFGGGYAPGPRAGVGEHTDTIVAHEMLHLLGFGHSDSECGGGGGGFPEPRGRMASVGIDTTEEPAADPSAPPYRIIADTQASPAFDVMSYCGQDWISALNWRRAIQTAPRRLQRRASRLAAPAVPSLRVRARVNRGGVGEIVSVGPARGPSPAPAPDAAYRVVARDAAGRELASAPVHAATAPDEPSRGLTTVLEGVVPAAGAARVEVTAGGSLLAARDRSANVPAVRLLAPRRLGGRAATVRWRTADADPGPREVALDYSADGGRSFAPVLSGFDTGVARVPVHLLGASRNGRLRLRVNDGFDEGEAISGRIVVPRRTPSVTIVSPPARQTVPAGSIVTLEGAADDDRGRPVRGRNLRWFAGRRALGRGEQLTTTLPAGTRTVRLVARDRSGRTGSATRRLRVRGSTPFFLRLSAPARLRRTARRLTLVVAASQPATLRVRGRRLRVGRSPRRVQVGVPAGSRAIRVAARLVAGGRSSARTVVVRRG